MNLNQVSALNLQSKEQKTSTSKNTSSGQNGDFADILAKKTTDTVSKDKTTSDKTDANQKDSTVDQSKPADKKEETENIEATDAKENTDKTEGETKDAPKAEEAPAENVLQAMSMMMINVPVDKTLVATPVAEESAPMIQNVEAVQPQNVVVSEEVVSAVKLQVEEQQPRVNTTQTTQTVPEQQPEQIQQTVKIENVDVNTNSNEAQSEQQSLTKEDVKETVAADMPAIHEETPQTAARAPQVMTTQTEAETTIPVNDSSSLLQRHTTTQVADKIVANLKDGQQQFVMTLHPERLGEVIVKMIFESGHLSLRVETHNQLAQNLLLGNIADLKNTLENEGVIVNEVDVSPYLSHDQQNEDQRSDQSRKDGQHTAKVLLSEEETDEEVEADVTTEDLLNYTA